MRDGEAVGRHREDKPVNVKALAARLRELLSFRSHGPKRRQRPGIDGDRPHAGPGLGLLHDAATGRRDHRFIEPDRPLGPADVGPPDPAHLAPAAS
jgi:hypothetical protein